MKSVDSYKTVIENYSAEIKIKKSTFIAQVYPMESAEKLSELINEVKKKYFDSAHNPFAYRIGLTKDIFRYNDDGEPSGTAGKPILEAIDRYQLTNILIVVTRYFGGTKLGVGRLKRAFLESAVEVLKNSKITEKFIYNKIKISFDYIYINKVLNFIKKKNIRILNNESGDKVNLVCEVRLSKYDDFLENLNNITSGSFRVINNE